MYFLPRYDNFSLFSDRRLALLLVSVFRCKVWNCRIQHTLHVTLLYNVVLVITNAVPSQHLLYLYLYFFILAVVAYVVQNDQIRHIRLNNFHLGYKGSCFFLTKFAVVQDNFAIESIFIKYASRASKHYCDRVAVNIQFKYFYITSSKYGNINSQLSY